MKHKILLLLSVLVAGFCNGAHAAKSTAPHSLLVYDLTQNQPIQEVNSDAVMSIASITKLMALIVIIENASNFDESLKVTKYPVKGHTKVRPGMSLTRKNLIVLSLINSDNRAVMTLAENFPGGPDALVSAMNRRAVDLEMIHSTFADPTGINALNTSTAKDLIKLLVETKRYPILTNHANLKFVEVSASFKEKSLSVVANNTNSLVSNNFIMSKTGFTRSAGFCLAWIYQQDDREYAGVILNEPNKYSRTRRVQRILASL